MTDKEQIMINDVDVSECIHLYSRWPGSIPPDSCACWEEPNDLTDTPVTDCKRHENCYFKQLARKTQECEQKDERILELMRAYEELKEKFEALKLENQEGYEIVAELKHECEELKRKVELMMDCPDCKVDEYKKALEEIEGLAKNFGSYAAWQEQRINKILDIINKAKEEE